MNKTELKEVKKELETLYQYLIREFYEFRSLFEMVEHANKSEKDKKTIKIFANHALRTLKGVFGEERVLRKAERSYNKFTEHFNKISQEVTKIKPEETEKFKKWLEQVNVYNAFLVKYGSRGGELEKALTDLKRNPESQSKLDLVVKEINGFMKKVPAFQEVIKELKTEYGGVEEWVWEYVESKRPKMVKEINSITKALNESDKYKFEDGSYASRFVDKKTNKLDAEGQAVLKELNKTFKSALEAKFGDISFKEAETDEQGNVTFEIYYKINLYLGSYIVSYHMASVESNRRDAIDHKFMVSYQDDIPGEWEPTVPPRHYNRKENN